ncbi:dephospho-CoA kinase [Pseudomonadales bacterium]|jgi:dephospho-CoA kinase|nr:dephospho-CoA kinase [Pseudomonadales bacterium]
MPIICLTGGIAAGKSTAARYFATRGAKVIDADQLGHATYEAGTVANDRLVETFGDAVRAEDGGIDRKALGGMVFGKPEALKQLTDIVWPEIRLLAEAQTQSLLKEDPSAIVILEAAVLFEAGWEDIGDATWVVITEPEVAIARAMARDGLTREAVEKRLSSQLSNTDRAARADLVIENNTLEADFVAALDAAWLGIAPIKD